MKYKVLWSNFAEQQIDEVFEFYKQKAKSHTFAKRIVLELLVALDKLKTNLP